jgi:hypothetical protein
MRDFMAEGLSPNDFYKCLVSACATGQFKISQVASVPCSFHMPLSYSYASALAAQWPPCPYAVAHRKAGGSVRCAI